MHTKLALNSHGDQCDFNHSRLHQSNSEWRAVLHVLHHEIVNHSHLLGYTNIGYKTILNIPKFLTPHPELFSLYHKATKTKQNICWEKLFKSSDYQKTFHIQVPWCINIKLPTPCCRCVSGTEHWSVCIAHQCSASRKGLERLNGKSSFCTSTFYGTFKILSTFRGRAILSDNREWSSERCTTVQMKKCWRGV